MQGNRDPDAFAFYKWPTENDAQYGHTQEIQTCETIYKHSAFYPNREMDQQKHYRIDNYRQPFSFFADGNIQQPAAKNHLLRNTYKKNINQIAAAEAVADSQSAFTNKSAYDQISGKAQIYRDIFKELHSICEHIL